MKVIYDISTCRYGCPGGDHTLQYLAGRAYNLSSAGFSLVRIAYYDEALNQARSLGELANLLSLFWTEPQHFEQWKVLAKRERRLKYGPAKVRKKLNKLNGNVVLDDVRYSSLCEIATHVTPQTTPNVHNDLSNPIVGGIPQEAGADFALNLFAFLSAAVATGYSIYYGLNDLEEQIVSMTKDIDDIEIR